MVALIIQVGCGRDLEKWWCFIPGTGTVTFNGATMNQIQITILLKPTKLFNNLTTNNTGGAKGN
jgi:hypothetical protein